MTENPGPSSPRTPKTILLGNVILGESRSAVFLEPPESSLRLPEKSPWTETLFWDDRWEAGGPALPVLIPVAPGGESAALKKAASLQGTPAALLTRHSGLEFLSKLADESSIPLILDLRGTSQPLRQALGALAAGIHGVVLPFPGAEEWEFFYPQVKSLVFSLERELVRSPRSKFAGAGINTAAHRTEGLSVAFQGERGAYSELAVFSLFDSKDTSARPMKAFRDVYEAVLRQDVDYGLLPLENALAGSIHDNFDLLLQYPDLHIIAETQIRIEHNLIVVPGTGMDEIRKVLSHPQGLAQSAAFLDQHPQWERVPFYDTAGSVAHIAQTGDRSLAAIASSVAAEVYGMEILKAGVETNPRNFTRFALIAPLSVPPLGRPNKASLVFSTAHSPGALSDCLTVLSAHSLNMRKIESRPIHGKPWAYMFYVDVEVPEDAANFEAAMAELTARASEFRLLGAYPAR